jgi:DNA-binding NarL/FixJ family response regulator
MIYETRIRVGIVETNHVLRKRLADIVRSQGDMVVTFSSAAFEHDTALDEVDVILSQWEIVSASCLRQWATDKNKPKLLVLNASPQHKGFLERIQCGASGFFLSSATEEEILDAIRTLMKNDWVVPPQVVPRLCSEIAQETASAEEGILGEVTLTKREGQITLLISQGLTNKEIAQELNIAVSTVKTHVHKTLTKPNLQRRRDIIRYMQRVHRASKQ